MFTTSAAVIKRPNPELASDSTRYKLEQRLYDENESRRLEDRSRFRLCLSSSLLIDVIPLHARSYITYRPCLMRPVSRNRVSSRDPP